MKKHLFLTGFMGSGKTYLGKRLAEQIHVSFLDLDHEIEKSEGRSISGVFSEKGQEYFRFLERKFLIRFLSGHFPPTVLSLGGGSLLNNAIIPEIKKAGLMVCLQRRSLALPNQLKSDRPLTYNQDVESLYRKRITGYSSAHACLRVDLFSEKDALNHLINLWNYHVMGS